MKGQGSKMIGYITRGDLNYKLMFSLYEDSMPLSPQSHLDRKLTLNGKVEIINKCFINMSHHNATG